MSIPAIVGWPAAGVAVLMLVGASPGSAMSAGQNPVARSGTDTRVEVRLYDLTAIRRLFHALARQGLAMTEGERVAAWADFSLLADAVIGETASPLTFDDLAGAAAGVTGPRVLATRGVATRDAAAYQLLALGYSARETGDVVSGRISRHALDTARRMIAVGRGRDAAADYLDSQYARVVAVPNEGRAPSRQRNARSPGPFDAVIEQYANLHKVETAIVRAMIETESAFNPAARSRAGAIGLMQLMPATARELGVNPFVPEQNIEGGVRYFSQLLSLFGGVELALVAYNAGPGFAERYARGQTALYGETRDYVKKVLARLIALR